MRNTLIVIGLIILVVWGMSVIDKKRMEEKRLAAQLSAPAVIVAEDEETLILVPADESDNQTMAAEQKQNAENVSNTVKEVANDSVDSAKEAYNSGYNAISNTAEMIEQKSKNTQTSLDTTRPINSNDTLNIME